MDLNQDNMDDITKDKPTQAPDSPNVDITLQLAMTQLSLEKARIIVEYLNAHPTYSKLNDQLEQELKSILVRGTLDRPLTNLN